MSQYPENKEILEAVERHNTIMLSEIIDVKGTTSKIYDAITGELKDLKKLTKSHTEEIERHTKEITRLNYVAYGTAFVVVIILIVKALS